MMFVSLVETIETLDGWKNGGFGLVGVVFKGRLIKERGKL
jgi:hypothetical protein